MTFKALIRIFDELPTENLTTLEEALTDYRERTPDAYPLLDAVQQSLIRRGETVDEPIDKNA